MFLAFIITILTNSTFAQAPPFPNGVANTFTLDEKEGYNGFIYSSIECGSDGTVYTCDYSGNIEIHGNNYSIKVDEAKNAGIITAFIIKSDTEVWGTSLKNIIIMKNNKLEKIIPLPPNVLQVFKNENGFDIFCANGTFVETYIFRGKNIEPLAVSDIKKKIINCAMYETFGSDIFLTLEVNGGIDIYKINKKNRTILYKKRYPDIYLIGKIKNENNFYARNKKNRAVIIKQGKQIPQPYFANTGGDNSINFYSGGNNNSILYKYAAANYISALIDTNLNITYKTAFVCDDEIAGTYKNRSGYLNYGLTGNKPLLISNYIKKYPAVFDGNNAASIFTIREDSTGRIWVGSYKNKIAIIDKDNITNLKTTAFKIMNGGSFYNNHMYFIGEGNEGLFQYDMQGNAKRIYTNITGFYTYLSKNKKHFYYTTTNHLGLWQTTTKSLETLNPVWNKIDSSKGNKINNILTITEDTLGRIWCGHRINGICIYNPTTDKATSWILDKHETPFDGFASLTDYRGTVWVGGKNGLWVYNDYTKNASPKNCIKINHPLINAAKNITALTVYGDWLVIAAYDKVLLLSLKDFYHDKKIIVRYLNPYETNFTSFTEQNTMLTAKDSSIWFSTGDMLYNWDIKNWLQLETPRVRTTIVAIGNGTNDSLFTNRTLVLNPTHNSFDITLHYVSTENMLRYTNTALVKDGDSVKMNEPSLENNFAFKNLQSGHYTFYVNVFEIDGTTSKYEFKIIIKKFLWQQWWFWLSIALLFIGIISYLLNLKKKKQLAEQTAKTKEAELLQLKAEQAKKISALQLVTLSSQFRPHFILNALNTIGAQIDDKPETESVLSRLGESINLIFTHAQQQKIVHSFANEWQLVQNIIHIHQSMYLKTLQTITPSTEALKEFMNVNVPLGILQIPIENALLHGLSNKEIGPWILKISTEENNDFITINITDNGVGRKKSATLSNFTKHGTGTKNLQEIISIINVFNNHKIMIEYRDDVFNENGVFYGTTVVVIFPKKLYYESE